MRTCQSTCMDVYDSVLINISASFCHSYVAITTMAPSPTHVIRRQQHFLLSLLLHTLEDMPNYGIFWVHINPLMIESESEPESYVTTDTQSASFSWNKAPIWGLRPDIY
jgi:hypothetical protein